MFRNYKFWIVFSITAAVLFFFIKRLVDEIAPQDSVDEILLPPLAQAKPVTTTSLPIQSKPTDDLTRIRGIGPKIASVLNVAGVMTFSQLANSGVKELQKILSDAGIRLTNVETWADQARTLST